MRIVWALFAVHLISLIFGLGGILIALPNPELWIDSAYGPEIFRFGINYGGSMHIWWGALTMLVFGGLTIGWTRTLIFFAAATSISLSAELLGTSTGVPFGDYAYLDGLGSKVLGRVPYTIPLSWFYLGFASYLLANAIVPAALSMRRALLVVAGGAYLLVVWDLVLDPAMAHESMPIRFWTWFDTGPYFGMPLINFAGWAVTGALFMTVARLLWRQDLSRDDYAPTLPYAVYLANIAFGVVLAINVDLWIPALLAVLLGALPVSLALSRSTGRRESADSQIGYRVMKAGAGFIQSRRLEMRIEGAGNIPENGPAVIVARHFHHLYDGMILTATVPRPVRILVGLDWIESRPLRRVMEFACRSVSWPIVLRQNGPALVGGTSAYDQLETTNYLRRAVRDSVNVLRKGEVLVVFPEAFPIVDPSESPRSEESEFLPFSDGFLRIARLAERDGGTNVAIIPTGLDYTASPQSHAEWNVTLRFGKAIQLPVGLPDVEFIRHVEQVVRALSITGEVGAPASQRELVVS